MALGAPVYASMSIASNLTQRFGGLPDVLNAEDTELVQVGLSLQEMQVLRRIRDAINDAVSEGVQSRRSIRWDHQIELLTRWTLARHKAGTGQVVTLGQCKFSISSNIFCNNFMSDIGSAAKKIIAICQNNGAMTLIIARTHSLDDVRPTTIDFEIHTEMERATAEAGIKIVDYVILAGPKSFSFRGHGYIPNCEAKFF